MFSLRYKIFALIFLIFTLSSVLLLVVENSCILRASKIIGSPNVPFLSKIAPCNYFDCCAKSGKINTPIFPEQCLDTETGIVYTACHDASFDWGCNKQRNDLGPYKIHLQHFIGNQTQAFEQFKHAQAQALKKFVYEQGQQRRDAEEEFVLAVQALESAAYRATKVDSSLRHSTNYTSDGEDTWSFMIPVINSNKRRQNRLVKNICSLIWPPHQLIGVTFLVDNHSRPLVEASSATLSACGIASIAIHDDPPMKYKQPADAMKRHALEGQFERRAAIAEARNYLLRLALQPRHTSVVWIDSDLFYFPPHVLKLLQHSGECLKVLDTSLWYIFWLHVK